MPRLKIRSRLRKIKVYLFEIDKTEYQHEPTRTKIALHTCAKWGMAPLFAGWSVYILTVGRVASNLFSNPGAQFTASMVSSGALTAVTCIITAPILIPMSLTFLVSGLAIGSVLALSYPKIDSANSSKQV